MRTQDILEEIGDINPEALTADGFEEAIVGYVERFGQPPVALYDRDKCISILMGRDKMPKQEAEEYFSFNVIGAGMGEGTPAFATIRRAVK